MKKLTESPPAPGIGICDGDAGGTCGDGDSAIPKYVGDTVVVCASCDGDHDPDDDALGGAVAEFESTPPGDVDAAAVTDALAPCERDAVAVTDDEASADGDADAAGVLLALTPTDSEAVAAVLTDAAADAPPDPAAQK